MKYITVIFSLLLCVTIHAADGIGTAPAKQGTLKPETLHIALLPDEDPAKILQENKEFAAYLEKALGCKVKLTVPHDYSIMIESMRAGRLHLAYFGPASYVLCKDKGTHIDAFAAKLKNGSTTYHSIIVANANAGISKLEDIKGKKFAYGDPASTSSHLIPKGELLKAKLIPRQDYKQNFLGSHDAVALNVQSASVDAGGMSQSIYNKLVKKETIDPEKVKVIHTSPAFPQYPWVMRSDLDPAFKSKIKKAFIQLKHAAILKALHAQGFAAIDDKAYDVVRTLEKTVSKYR